jgi:hypothetical protein
MTNTLPDTPTAAVAAWWQAMQNQDLDALKRLTAGDYVISGGPTGRTASQDQFLEEAEHSSPGPPRSTPGRCQPSPSVTPEP